MDMNFAILFSKMKNIYVCEVMNNKNLINSIFFYQQNKKKKY